MRRRRFIAAALLAALAPPLRAQRRREVPAVGALYEQALPNAFSRSFSDGIAELGHVQGEDLRVEQRSARGAASRLRGLAAELARRKVQVILAAGDEAARAAAQATAAIPIVFAAVSDPVMHLLVRDPQRPEGHVTGVAPFESRRHAKRLELVRELVPRVQRIAVLFDPAVAQNEVLSLQQAASAQRVTLKLIGGRNPEELRIAMDAGRKQSAQALLVLPSAAFSAFRQAVLELAAAHRLPALYPERGFVDAGGLAAYGPDLPAMFKPAARLVLSLLQGAKVAKLPVEEAKFELAVNLRTARTGHWTMPRSMIARADRVIQ